jgi:Ca2+/H+ antiporter, TMEM165/GDT1 family
MLEAFTSALVLITSQELGDKTFFIALILAMRYPRRWVCGGVIVGGIAGHTICALIAVLGGRWAAGRISERLVTWI